VRCTGGGISRRLDLAPGQAQTPRKKDPALQLSTAIAPRNRGLGPSLDDISRAEWLGLLAVVAVAAGLDYLCSVHPTALPFWAPFEFSWSQFLAAAFAVLWYARGLALTEPAARPSPWRQLSFALGLLSIYVVLLTHFEYMAQHMFFLNRFQHMAMHHLGPFLIALAWPAETLLRGMPAPLRRLIQNERLGRVMWAIQQPFIAGTIFVGLIYFWLVPAVHFHAMIDPQLYSFMNWTMVIDGLLFWSLVLDPRPAPLARASYGMRLLVTILVMFPQILIGSSVTFSTTTLYPYYDLCGRLYPTIGALLDQHIGGVILWIPSSMMSSIAFMLTLNHVRLNDERQPATEYDDDGPIPIAASGWTGR
jgi:putative membrane protein